MMLIGIAVFGMLAIGCGGTVVVTATPTAVVVVLPTPTAVPTATPAPMATPDIRAALRVECNLVMASVLKPFVVIVEQYGEDLGDQAWGHRASWDTVISEEEIVEELTRLYRVLPDSSIAYLYRLTGGVDFNASDGEVFVTMLNRIIDDLEDGDCGSVELRSEEYRL